MYYFSLFVCIVIGIIIGLFSAGIFNKNNNNQELHKYIPSIEEILCVLHVIRATYRCTSYEADCMEEAIRLIESMSGENENGE